LAVTACLGLHLILHSASLRQIVLTPEAYGRRPGHSGPSLCLRHPIAARPRAIRNLAVVQFQNRRKLLLVGLATEQRPDSVAMKTGICSSAVGFLRTGGFY